MFYPTPDPRLRHPSLRASSLFGSHARVSREIYFGRERRGAAGGLGRERRKSLQPRPQGLLLNDFQNGGSPF